MTQNRDKPELQRINKEIEHQRDLKQDTDNALLMSQVKATLAEFLTTMDNRYNPQPQPNYGTTVNPINPSTDKSECPYTSRVELKRSRSPTTPPDRPAPSVRRPPEDNDSMTLDQEDDATETLLTQEETPRRSQRNTPPTTSVVEEIA